MQATGPAITMVQTKKLYSESVTVLKGHRKSGWVADNITPLLTGVSREVSFISAITVICALGSVEVTAYKRSVGIELTVHHAVESM